MADRLLAKLLVMGGRAMVQPYSPMPSHHQPMKPCVDALNEILSHELPASFFSSSTKYSTWLSKYAAAFCNGNLQMTELNYGQHSAPVRRPKVSAGLTATARCMCAQPFD